MTWAENLVGLAGAALDEAAFGEPVTTPVGIFFAVIDDESAPYEMHERGTTKGSLVQGQRRQPGMALRNAEAALLSKGMAVSMRGENFVISAEGRSDGYGMMWFALERAQPTNPTGETQWR
jgi:hypothetical protein